MNKAERYCWICAAIIFGVCELVQMNARQKAELRAELAESQLQQRLERPGTGRIFHIRSDDFTALSNILQVARAGDVVDVSPGTNTWK